jgi:hypothetical protein
VDSSSGRQTEVFSARWIAWQGVAEDTGELVWLASKDGRLPISVWHMGSGGQPEQTKVVLDAAPARAVVSPDGGRLAVVGEKGKEITIYDLADGGHVVIPPFAEGAPGFFQWVLGGRALLSPTADGLWLVPIPEKTVAAVTRP